MLNKTFKFITEDDVGFIPLQPWQVPCTDSNHNPPTHIYIPPDTLFRHKCPSCGMIQEIFGSATYC